MPATPPSGAHAARSPSSSSSSPSATSALPPPAPPAAPLAVTPRAQWWTVHCPRWCCCGLSGAPVLVWGALRVAALLIALFVVLLAYRASKARFNDELVRELEQGGAARGA
jgi:hypothetical protein